MTINSLQKVHSNSTPLTLNSQIKQLLGSLSILVSYIITDLEKKPRSFKIGVFSVFLVVTFLVVLQSALTLSPGIFLRLAENEAGQSDFTIIPIAAANDTRLAESGSESSLPLFRGLNFTDMEERMKGLSTVSGIAPRWILPVDVSDPSTPEANFSVIGLVLDSQMERERGFGSHLKIEDLGMEECWISGSTARLARIQSDSVNVHLDLFDTLARMQVIASAGSATVDPNEYPRMIAEQLVKQQLEANGGVQVDNEMYAFGEGPGTVKIGRLLEGDDYISIIRKNNRVLQSTINFTNITIDSDFLNNFTIPINLTDVPDDATMDDVTILVNSTRLVDALVPAIRNGFTLDQNFTVKEVVESSKGKWASNFGNVIVVDSRYLPKIFERNLIRAVNETNITANNTIADEWLQENFNKTDIIEQIQQSAAEFRMNDIALMVNVLISNRKETYRSSTSVKPNLIRASNGIYARLGRDHPSQISSPLDSTLTMFFLFKNFLDNIFNSTVFILILLSALLIYSLMNSNVEEKTYEFGMLRALGMKKTNLTSLLIIQSMFFAIPGLVLGLILSFALNFMVSYYISNLASLQNDVVPSDSSLALGICIALIVPFFANYLPIRKALSKTLRDSLNIYNRTISDMTVRMIKLAKIGISPAQTIGALTLIVMGFLTYYVAPYSFIFQNLPLFFIILNIVMMMMVIGFTLLLNLLQPIIERIILKVFTFPIKKERVLEPVIIKNFSAHRKRNTKTSLMFSIALAFLIYAGTGFRLNTNIIAKGLEVLSGADLVLQSLGTVYLNETELRGALDEFNVNFPGVMRDYAFVSQSFRDQPYTSQIRASSLAREPYRRVRLVSVDESYLRSCYEQHFVGVDFDPTVNWPRIPGGKIDAIAGLYSYEDLEMDLVYDKNKVVANAGPYNLSLNSYIGEREVRVMVPEGLTLDVSIQAGGQGLIIMSPLRFKTRIRSVASKLPGFLYSSYRTFATYTVITSHEDYEYMRGKLWERTATASQQQEFLDKIPVGSSYNVAKQGLLIRYNNGVSEKMRTQLKNAVGTKIDSDNILVVDVIDTVSELRDTLFFIDIFFILVTIIAISLSFFFTVISFTSNISENAWEFGVLRAIGLSKNQMMKIYVLEALCLILSAAFLGTIVGLLVASTSSIMFFLFTELPFVLEFPTTVFLVALGSSIVTAFVSSKIAVDEVKNKQISSIIKALE